MPPEEVRSITWDAYEHYHIEKGSDWFWILGIITVAITIAAILLSNMLFGVLILIGGLVIALHANHEPDIIEYAVTLRGMRVGDTIYPYSTLDSFYIDEEHPAGARLLVRSQKLFMPLFIISIPEENVDDIEELIASRLPEEHMDEPLVYKILEFFGF